MSFDYSEDDIRAVTSNSAFQKGRDYWNRSKVGQFEIQNGRIHATVHGGSSFPYRQSITIGPRVNGRTGITSACTCPVAINCKHVVAALLEGLARKQQGDEVSDTPESLRTRRAAKLAGPMAAGKPGQSSALAVSELSPPLQTWLKTLVETGDQDSEDYPPDMPQRIYYVFMPKLSGTALALAVMPYSVRLLKSGGLAAGPKPYTVSSLQDGNPGRYLRPSDHAILTELYRGARVYSPEDRGFGARGRDQILRQILATGRARWLRPEGAALGEGPEVQGRIAWGLTENATMQPTIETGQPLLILKAMPPVYVDAAQGLIGKVETGYPPALACRLLDAPPVPVQEAEALGAALTRRVPALAAAAPTPPPPPRRVDGAPRPRLHLRAASLPVNDPRYARYNIYQYQYLPHEPVGLARLSFLYDGFEVQLGETRPVVLAAAGAGLAEVHRDLKAEHSLIEALLAEGLGPVAEIRIGVPAALEKDFMPEDGDEAWFDVMFDVMPALKAKGWQINAADDFPYRLVRPDGDIEAGIREGSGIDWFDLDLGVTIDGERVNLVPAILKLIAMPGYDPGEFAGDEDEAFYLLLPDGRMLALPAGRIAPIVAALYELSGGFASDGSIRLSLADAAGLAEFEAAVTGLGVVWQGGERIREMGALLRASGGIPPVALPSTFKAELRPYQAQGVAWLQFLRQFGLGGILADDMGLGKTVQALAVIAIEKAEGRLDKPALVVAPTSLMANWRSEAEKFAPDLKVLTLQGLDRRERFSEIASSDLVLSTYPLMTRDHDELKKHTWHIAILDEAQIIKNPDATTARLIAGIEARHRFCLTGTPLENHLGELWSLFSFAQPGVSVRPQEFHQPLPHADREARRPRARTAAGQAGEAVHAPAQQVRGRRRTAAEDRNRRAGRTHISAAQCL